MWTCSCIPHSSKQCIILMITHIMVKMITIGRETKTMSNMMTRGGGGGWRWQWRVTMTMTMMMITRAQAESFLHPGVPDSYACSILVKSHNMILWITSLHRFSPNFPRQHKSPHETDTGGDWFRNPKQWTTLILMSHLRNWVKPKELLEAPLNSNTGTGLFDRSNH